MYSSVIRPVSRRILCQVSVGSLTVLVPTKVGVDDITACSLVVYFLLFSLERPEEKTSIFSQLTKSDYLALNYSYVEGYGTSLVYPSRPL